MPRDALGKQFLVARQQQVETAGHGKRQLVEFLLLTADVADAASLFRTALEQGANEALGRTDVHRMFGKDGTQGFFVKAALGLQQSRLQQRDQALEQFVHAAAERVGILLQQHLVLADSHRTRALAQRTVVQLLLKLLVAQLGETLFPQAIETGQVDILLACHRSQVGSILAGKGVARLVLHIALHQQNSAD